MEPILKLGLQVAGAAQLALCLGSIAIPACLNWKERTAGLIPFMRQIFYTYAVYILASHFFFALVSLCFADELLSGGGVEKMLLGLMGAWWTGRIFCQFFYFDRTGIPESRFNGVAEMILVTLFFCLVTVYWGALIWTYYQ